MTGLLRKQDTRQPWLIKSIERLLSRVIRDGSLTIRFPDGSRAQLGQGTGPTIAVTSWRAVRRILLHPTLAFGEAFVDGTLIPVGCSIDDVLETLLRGRTEAVGRGLGPAVAVHDALARLGKRAAQYNPARVARRNAAHHYDLHADFYRLLLDPDLQYSCAYFRTGAETLEAAQEAKKHHIARKLLLDRPGLRVLDIGCGWGGLALTLARDYGAEVTGITLSQEQWTVARARAEHAGLADRVHFEMLDYRALDRTFDRVVSVGMFEHVGVTHYRAFFAALRRSLAPDGVALVHAIGRLRGPSTTNPWLARYIFPGGYSPALSEVLPHVERSGLIATDLEVLRLHYALTLARWRENLDRHRDEVRRLYDDRFLRLFDFYLAGAELAFRHTGHMVWQLQLSRRLDTVPLTRNYLFSGAAVSSSAVQSAST